MDNENKEALLELLDILKEEVTEYDVEYFSLHDTRESFFTSSVEDSNIIGTEIRLRIRFKPEASFEQDSEE